MCECKKIISSFVFDRADKTAESTGKSLFPQFDSFEYEEIIFSFISTKAEELIVASEIQQ